MEEVRVLREARRIKTGSYTRNQTSVFSRYVVMLALCFSVVRLILAAFMELGTDESYYWLYTQRLRWNYFDHPAMVAVWGRLFSLNLLGQNELLVRLGSIVSAAFATWFIFKATATFYSEKAGWYAAILLNTSFYAGIVAGIFIMPDSPQLFFWTLSLWMIARIIMVDERGWTNWIIFGLASGLCIMSKVHGAFIPLGFLLYAFLVKKKLLHLPQLYLAFFICSLCLLPMIIWNWNHDFVTFRFQGNRIVLEGFHLNHQYFVNEWFGQLLMNNPVNVALIAFSLTIGYRHITATHPRLLVLIFIGLPLCFILLLVSLFRSVFPHWSGPAYITLIPVAAIWLVQFTNKRFLRRWLSASIIAFVLFIVGWQGAINFLPGTIGSKNELTLGKGDVTLDRYGWDEAGDVFRSFYIDAIKGHQLPANTPLVTHKWWGAHIEYYFCRPLGIPMIGLGTINEAGTYLWMNERYKQIERSVALCIIPSDEYVDAKAVYSKWYKTVSFIKAIDVFRNGKKAHRFSIFLLEGKR